MGKVDDVVKPIRITDLSGFKTGHAQNFEAATGCTVIICEAGAVAGVDVRGGSPGDARYRRLEPDQ